MKRALMLTALFLCTTGVYAEETRVDTITEGRKRNEEAYERALEQTGWKSESSRQAQTEKEARPTPRQTPEGSSQPKSS